MGPGPIRVKVRDARLQADGLAEVRNGLRGLAFHAQRLAATVVDPSGLGIHFDGRAILRGGLIVGVARIRGPPAAGVRRETMRVERAEIQEESGEGHIAPHRRQRAAQAHRIALRSGRQPCARQLRGEVAGFPGLPVEQRPAHPCPVKEQDQAGDGS